MIELDIYKIGFQASLMVYKIYYKRMSFIKHDLLMSGYLYVLEHQSQLTQTTDKELFHKCMKFASYGMIKFLKSNTNVLSLDKNIKDSGKTLSDYIVDSSNVDDNLKVFYLKQQIKKFCSLYDKQSVQVFKLFYNDYNIGQISKALSLEPGKISDMILNFRIDLYDYLISLGFIDNKKIVFSKLDFYRSGTLNAYKCKQRKIAKENNSLDYSSYENDLLIYKLIRDDGNLEDFSNCLHIDISYLKRVIYHKHNSCKLLLYQIQKLRSQFFPKYSLEDLVLCK